MNKKEKHLLTSKFLSLMQEVGASYEDGRYFIPWADYKLGCTLYAESDPWVACKWECGDKSKLRAYLDHKGGNALAEEDATSAALWDEYRASVKRDHEGIKASGLPYHNPYSLKWNHHGTEGTPCPVDSLREGLAPLLIQKQQ